MPNINPEFSDQEMKALLDKKLAESKRQGKELSWKEFILIAAEKIKE